MGIKKYLPVIFFIAIIQTAKGQVNTLNSADSISTSLYNSADWKQLILFGNSAINNGNDTPDLRLRIAYAYFITGDYKKSLYEYDKVLVNNSYNSTARYYAYFCNKYLNNDVQASYNVSYLDKATVKGWLSPFDLVDAGFEAGVKENNDVNRDDANYYRVGFSNRLGWRFQLEESFAYFNEDIFSVSNDYPSNRSDDLSDQQKEYYAKLNFAVNNRLTIIGSYHYLDTKFINTIYNNNLGLLGLKYITTYADLQADVNFGKLDSKPIEQYDGKLIFYPLGNFNLYTISMASAQHLNAADHFIFNQAAGFKLMKNTWLESDVTFGNQDDYLDQDGLYVYNGIDNTTFKCGETVFYQLGKHARLQLNYTYEKKQDSFTELKYDQNSTTIGMLWKF